MGTRVCCVATSALVVGLLALAPECYAQPFQTGQKVTVRDAHSRYGGADLPATVTGEGYGGKVKVHYDVPGMPWQYADEDVPSDWITGPANGAPAAPGAAFAAPAAAVLTGGPPQAGQKVMVRDAHSRFGGANIPATVTGVGYDGKVRLHYDAPGLPWQYADEDVPADWIVGAANGP